METKQKSKKAKAENTVNPIHKDMTLGEVLAKYPETAEVMQKYDLHCFGCSVSYVETLEQGVLSHGYDSKIVKNMIDDMNAYVKEHHDPSKPKRDLNVTKLAAEKILELAKKENMEGYGLRFAVIPGGCSGFQYGMNFEKEAAKDDVVFEENGVKIFIDAESLNFVKGVKIDYVDSLQGSGFKITNPNAKSSCGCGKSFS
jgi:iron-sulfur cluster assembly accessory protein